MNVKQLKQILEGLPDHLEVYLFDEDAEFPCRAIESAEAREVEYREDSSTPEPLAKDRALVLTPH